MKRYLVSAAALGAAFVLIAATDKDQQDEHKPKVEVVSVGPDGKPDVVKVDGYTMKVCKGDVTDGCINPQDAGFDWGGKEIDYWPGKPASEIEGKLPEHQPDNGGKQD
jgi:hypothetical protein